MRAKIALVAATVIVSLMIGEVGLRVFMPRLGMDPVGSTPRASPSRYDNRIGYELKPFVLVETIDDRGRTILERMNSDGFRGREYDIPKQSGTFRILVVGDSVVQGLGVSYAQTWEQVLERALNRSTSTPVRYEVINAGIGGYVSWQALVRLTDRGLKYQPDLVLVLVGWNDLVYSSVPEWTPGMDLTKFDQAFVARAARDQQSDGGWRAVRQVAYRHSYVARLIRQARNNVYHARRIRALVARRQIDSGIPFNEAALRLYVRNLERIHAAIQARQARMGLIVWPTILVPELLSDPEVHERLVLIYSLFPLSTRELWDWYRRYASAQRQFAARHPDVILIDVEHHLQQASRHARLEIFSDLAHLTRGGNDVLAQIVLADLTKRGTPRGDSR